MLTTQPARLKPGVTREAAIGAASSVEKAASTDIVRGRALIFWDLNEGAAVTLNYRLNFDSGPSVDPIVDNGGGNWQ